jgi:predicted metal-dependent RNase
MKGFINQDAFVQQLAIELKEEMIVAAEPLIAEAMEAFEKQIRAIVAQKVMGLIELNYKAERRENHIVIEILQEK